MTTIHTIGYGGRKPGEFLALLTARGIHMVADVRLRPDRASMGSYVLAKDAGKGITGLLTRAGIGYVSLPELGNPFRDSEDWQAQYRHLLEQAGMQRTGRIWNLPRPLCLLCAEKDPDRCHRKLIGEYLIRHGLQVQHIL